MKGRVAILDQIAGRPAAALVVDGKLQDFLIDPVSQAAPVPGAVFRAVCGRPLKGQGGMMLRLPDGAGFLRQGRGLRPGQTLLVQVTGYAEAGKAIPVTNRVIFKGRYAIVTPGAPGINLSRTIRDEEERVRLLEIATEAMAKGEAGLIIRSTAEFADDTEIAGDITSLLEIHSKISPEGHSSTPELLLEGPGAHALAWRDWGQVDNVSDAPGEFEAQGVLEMIDQILSDKVSLSGGATAFIEPTRALIAVDVNTGSDTSSAAGLKANIALSRDLPRQLRCRGLGGQITIDFAPLSKKDRPQVEQALKSAFRSDSIETALVGWTPLGHFELQRKRERLPVAESLRL